VMYLDGDGRRRRRYIIRKDDWGTYAVWDRKNDNWLYPEPDDLDQPARILFTRASAWHYLKAASTNSKRYRLRVVERALDGYAS
jgi:hypothetical protein